MCSGGLNQQPGPINEDALQMLRDKQLAKYAELVSADDVVLGQILRLRHRQHDINPALKLYGTYFEVYNPLYGSNSYIPVDFVITYDEIANRVTLSVKQAVVERELWYREPTFIAGGQERVEELPERVT